MNLSATFDPVLSRVRLSAAALGARNSNPFFETDVTNWTAFGGTRTRSTVQQHQGVASLLLTPDGVTATVRAESEQTTGVVPAVVWRAQAWVRCAVATTVTIGINWFNAASTYLSTSSTGTAVSAGTWTLLTLQAAAPATAARASMFVSLGGTPAGTTLLYVDEAMVGPAAALTASTVLFERSSNGARWTTVRGGAAVPVTDRAAALDDYEFAAGALNHYRVTAAGETATTTITPAQTAVWFKSITRPFLNRPVTVVSHGDITSPARNGVFPVIGRSFPIAVTDVRLSRQWDMVIKADNLSEADALDVVFASGDPLYVQVPATGPLATIPGGYVVVGDVKRARYGHLSARRTFELPMTEVAAPGPDVVGSTVTWETLVAEFGTWQSLLAEFGTWAEVAEYVADPDVVIVP
jgi:hypothetical protein